MYDGLNERMISNYRCEAGGEVEMTHPVEPYICKVCRLYNSI